MERFYYGKSIAEFLGEDSDAIFGALSRAESFDTARDQKNAWNEEIGLLKSILQGYEGYVFFEYSIPRLGKRVDVVLLIKGVVLCLEFKAGAERFEAFFRDRRVGAEVGERFFGGGEPVALLFERGLRSRFDAV